jgi:hypothetical protein
MSRWNNRHQKTSTANAKSLLSPCLVKLKIACGFRGFSVRGKEKVAGEFSMVYAAHNFKKIVKAIITGLIRPEFGNFTVNPAI